MNQKGEKINVKESSCREMNPKELLQLLQFNKSIFWSWGVPSTSYKIDSKIQTKMLRFTVSGHHHKGHVYIFLNGNDLFDVFLTSNQGTIRDRTEYLGLYFDDLVEWIDNKIERLPAYS